MADQIQATPRGFISGLFSDVLGRTMNMPSLPRTGIPSLDLLYANRNSLFNMMGVGDVQKTAERISYGEPLTTGAGMTLRPREETINAAMNVAPFVKPAAVMANRAAMTAGRAGERLAERVVPQVMERGGLPAQLLGDVSRGSVSPLDVYHGTPHTLPPTPRNPLGEFDASKIGSGEGAQAYGYGIYTAEAPVVAKEYQKKLSSAGSAKNLANQYGGIDEGLAEAMRRVESYKQLIADGGGGAMERVKSLLRISEKNVEDLSRMKAGLPENTGNLYKVDLPDEKIATMLDWDKPLSQQSPQVQAALKGIENDLPSIPDFDLKKWMDADPLASTWHNVLARDLRVEPSKISELLQNKGIAGIRYLDEGSRATTGKQTSNFVVFPNEEKSMTILERNGITASQIENPAYTDPFGNTIGSSIR